MSYTTKLPEAVQTLMRAGIKRDDAMSLRRCSMTLHRWFEMECGSDAGCIERDETTGIPYFRQADSNVRTATADLETGAKKRIDEIMKDYPTLSYYIQGDPRGCALYILRPGDIPEGSKPDECYSRGLAVYR